jgi:hypothetical protein
MLNFTSLAVVGNIIDQTFECYLQPAICLRQTKYN